MTDSLKSPFNVRCGDCQHVWAAAWLPMEMFKVAKIVRHLTCPKCAAPSKRIFMAYETGDKDA
jgi:hypothetical protein